MHNTHAPTCVHAHAWVVSAPQLGECSLLPGEEEPGVARICRLQHAAQALVPCSPKMYVLTPIAGDL
eukprot:4344304-Alexandrium_andersonii.AAC.1